MDPTETLEEIRKLVDQLLHGTDIPGSEHAALQDDARDGVRLAKLVEKFDDFMTRGGFKPRQWDQATS